jgi:hypothetical protein
MSTPYRSCAPRTTTAESASSLLGAEVRSYYGAANQGVIWAAVPFLSLLGYGVWLGSDMQLDKWLCHGFSVPVVASLLGSAVVLIVYTSAVGGGAMLRVHADGLLDLRGGPRAIRWDQMRSLTVVAREDGRNVGAYVLRTTDGASVSLGPSIGGVRDLVDAIRMRMADPEPRKVDAPGDRLCG